MFYGELMVGEFDEPITGFEWTDEESAQALHQQGFTIVDCDEGWLVAKYDCLDSAPAEILTHNELISLVRQAEAHRGLCQVKH